MAEPRWIVNDMGELGVMVDGRAYFLYKGDNIVYESGLHDDGTPILYRMVGKREFGETCQPLPHFREKWPGWRYLEPLVFTPGLSFGKPEDGEWKPLPADGVSGTLPAPATLPESMSRDEILRYYSEYANMVCGEVAGYQKRIRDLEAALRDITEDYADRHDLDSPSTNPGIKSVIRQAREALSTPGVTVPHGEVK